MWNSREFEPQIHYIRFPRFRNLEPGLKIQFESPITAIVGQNGTNKSSILRAVQGCPDYENIGKYWFGTAIDVIKPEDRDRFIYGTWSESAHQVVEVMKTRIRRRTSGYSAADPDYFEPSRPIVGDGMAAMPPAPDPLPPDRTPTRWKAIAKRVIYLDFRADISAFDKYFYHNDFRARRSARGMGRDPLRERKELIRERSKRLKAILDHRLESYRPGGKEWILKPPESLSRAELDAVGEILGREYSRIDVVSHTAFEVSGTTALLHTADFSYSEAWAGSGEFAVVQLVTALFSAPDRALVLLDEPEVSLHPGAQRRLVSYLMRQARDKKLQIVFATHSPAMIETFPAVAIKVLEIAPSTHRVTIRRQHSSPNEAFVAIEHRFPKKTIVVEDALAKEVVVRALRGNEALLQTVGVQFQPGGAAFVKSRFIPLWAAEAADDVLLYLDGDQRLNPALRSAGSIAPEELQAEVRRLLGVSTLAPYIPANTGGTTESQLRCILEWANRYVRYLAGVTPEAWLCRLFLAESSTRDSKDWWRKETFDALGKTSAEDVSSEEILNWQKKRLAEVPVENPDLVGIREEIERFVERGS